MFKKKSIKISKELYQQLVIEAKNRGYSDVHEFVEHILSQFDTTIYSNDIEVRLKGLGYIDG